MSVSVHNKPQNSGGQSRKKALNLRTIWITWQDSLSKAETKTNLTSPVSFYPSVVKTCDSCDWHLPLDTKKFPRASFLSLCVSRPLLVVSLPWRKEGESVI